MNKASSSEPKHHEWLCKSNFSFLKGASKPADLLLRATKLGYASLCLNDFDGIYGLARLYREATFLKQDGFTPPKLHYGTELHLAPDHDLPLLLQSTLALVVLNDIGYRNLCALISLSHKTKAKAFLSPQELCQHSVEGLAAIVPMRGIVRTKEETSLLSFWHPIKAHFEGRFYFAISRHLHWAEDMWLARTIEVADNLGAPCLISQDVFFHDRSQKPMSDLLQIIACNKTFATGSEYLFPNSERHLYDQATITSRYSHLSLYQQALVHSEKLAQACEFELSSLRYSYPKHRLEEEKSTDEFLAKLTWEGIRQRLGGPVPIKVEASIVKELAIIKKMKFADYFLTVWDIVKWAKAQNILCQGRGSAANSVVCFALGITSVDPSIFDLLFERFISEERNDPPDIDVDFEHERREEVIQYIYEHYGRRYAAMVANVITYRTKGAMRAVGKALGVPEEDLEQLAKIASMKHMRSRSFLEILTFYTNQNPDRLAKISLEMWAALSESLYGFPRHLGIHSGGFMLADRELDALVAQEPATMAGRSVIQWSKEDIEALGFFKIDILALGMLTAVRKAFAMIEKAHGLTLSMSSICKIDDAKTYAMIERADTVGTFQIESRAQMSMLPRLRPRCFYDLVIEVAIIRPGPIQGGVIHPYLARREGKEKVCFPDERLKPILEKTLGIPIFQEQAMRIAIEVGDFTPGEANELRRNIGAWNIKDAERNLNPWLKKLASGMARNKIAPEFAEQILGQMRGFAEYGFPESHAISFALIAYVSAYLKCHYPHVFFAAVLNSQPMGFYSPHSLLQAAKRDGVAILPICVKDSFWDHVLESYGEGYAIRLGFRLIGGLQQKNMEVFLREREKRKPGKLWHGAKDFFQTSGLYRSDLSALAAADALAFFGLSRSEAIWQAEAAPFATYCDSEEETLAWIPETPMARSRRDFSSFQTSLDQHPAQIVREHAWHYELALAKLVASRDLSQMLPNQRVHVFGLVLFKQAPPSAKGMVFITLEDEYGFINLVFTPQKYAAFASKIGNFACASGKLQRQGLSHSVLVNQVWG